MFMKEKYRPDGTFDKMKARLVAGGNEQDLEMIVDVSSPTMSLSALLKVIALAKKEEREVASTDVPGAYPNAVMGEENPVYAWLDPVNTKIMCRVD
jgi:ABC-type Zn uptake system ZnuABC Zn-binding protein ZnuA